MSELLKATVGSILGAISERNIVKLQSEKIPNIPKGKENYIFNVGQDVRTGPTSTRKPGLRGKVKERYKQHGYCYYVLSDGLGTQRQRDLTIS